MNIKHIIHNLFAGLGICVGLLAISNDSLAEAPQISAKLSATEMLMGEKISLDVQVVGSRGEKGYFPIFEGKQPTEYATLCGDTVELGADFKSSSIDLGRGKMQTDYQISVQVFDSGFYKLPPIAYVSGKDTVRTQPLTLKVEPVKVQATDEMSDFTNVLPPEEGPFYDKIPLFILEWWWAILLLLLAGVGFALFLMRYKLVRLKNASKPLPPYEQAITSLARLHSEQLWQKGEVKEYYTRLVDILRNYISGRFEIHAMEMNTGQILESVKKHQRIKPYLKQFETVLNVADFAKFANMQATPEENEGAYDEVKKFVDDTRPTEEEVKADEEKMKKSEAPQQKARWEKRKPTSSKKSRKEVKK